ncbi:ribosomal RNA small subunit methyltransferase A [endosymbiont of Sipalinus gigas]|uniref:16S rRNA (adenine(1518)-N(6)/adenine(1519)-N(6))- dimethyltransferase RsmA n=1 Tax=endosymbiont of Sipalinus gigas TaxID=1972134 RepID=UPI000DC72402|nr:16S rRNA (adenine(1518)-N(6)/adenine(1519)-N(6))-dimethyltransferase RsmA [endosymbiont of Sipalinus gigas]BBA85351.1 ribosomal RNA small subunit methyltransferase A [endosymbiont of Sipalinus gigas]
MKKIKYDQYILNNNYIVDYIVNYLNLNIKSNSIVEIGPGSCVITKKIINIFKKIYLIEIDKNIIPNYFLYKKNIDIIIEDARYFNFYNLYLKNNKNKLVIFGNLPYCFSVPIIINIVKYRNYIKDVLFMVQKELCDRLLYNINSKKYGRLSVIVNLFFNTKKILDNIKPNSFIPEPKVLSSIIRMSLKNVNYNIDLDKIKKITFILFNNKRKKVKNNLLKYFSLSIISKLDNKILNMRPENISIHEILNIINLLNF